MWILLSLEEEREEEEKTEQLKPEHPTQLHVQQQNVLAGSSRT